MEVPGLRTRILTGVEVTSRARQYVHQYHPHERKPGVSQAPGTRVSGGSGFHGAGVEQPLGVTLSITDAVFGKLDVFKLTTPERLRRTV
jgi:hypothetical protein